jgi:hypothetical protein
MNTSYTNTFESDKGELEAIAFRGRTRGMQFLIALAERFHLVTCEETAYFPGLEQLITTGSEFHHYYYKDTSDIFGRSYWITTEVNTIYIIT